LAPEALVWAYRIFRATAEYNFPLVPDRAGWSQFLELEYSQRAWAQTEEGQRYFAECHQLEELVRTQFVPELATITEGAHLKTLRLLRGDRYRLLTVPNPKLDFALICTDPPDVVLFSCRIFSGDPLLSVALFWYDWWLASLCMQTSIRRIISDPYKNGLFELALRAGSVAEQRQHLEVVRTRLLRTVQNIPYADLVKEEVVDDYILSETDKKNTRDLYEFQDRLLSGKAGSVTGYRRDVMNAVAKWRWRFDDLDDPEKFAGPDSEDSIIEDVALRETGRRLDQAEPALERIGGKGAYEAARARFDDPELTNDEVAKRVGVSEKTLRRFRARARGRREALRPLLRDLQGFERKDLTG
jgi:hypothetical protein